MAQPNFNALEDHLINMQQGLQQGAAAAAGIQQKVVLFPNIPRIINLQPQRIQHIQGQNAQQQQQLAQLQQQLAQLQEQVENQIAAINECLNNVENLCPIRLYNAALTYDSHI
ncbi:hypothetical protein F5888DRAFT_1638715 [Russula emetica]|nr:hypothetical protein F5888DRAFT_1638715 [Russula emetica]